MKTSAEVLAALVATVKLIKIANGYANDLPDDKVYSRWIPAIADNHNDDAYPKCFIIMSDGTDTKMPSEQELRNLVFHVAVSVKKINNSQDPQVMIMSYLNDLEKLFTAQHTLQGTVQDIAVTNFAVDGGALDPEGALILRLNTQRFSF